MMMVAAGLCLRLGWLQVAHISALRSRIEPPRKLVQKIRLFAGLRSSRIFELASLSARLRPSCEQEVQNVFLRNEPEQSSIRCYCALAACRRRQKKYEIPQSIRVPAAQPHASGPSPTARWAIIAEPRSMAKPA